MTELESLTRAVVADPADDTARLVLADWLSENGEGERARLIRCQVRRGGTAHNNTPWDMPRLSIRRWFAPWWRGRSCWTFHNPQWDLLVHRVRGTDEHGPNWNGFYVRRGFVDQIVLPFESFKDEVKRGLFTRQPITQVIISDGMPIFPSSGNNTYYVGNLGWFPQKYWNRLDGLHSERAAKDARSQACVDWAREEAGLPSLNHAAQATDTRVGT